jgi:hypothetical protein
MYNVTWIVHMTDRLTENCRRYGIEINVEKTKVNRNSRQQSPAQMMVDQKNLGNVDN